jgi:hypothetical protein
VGCITRSENAHFLILEFDRDDLRVYIRGILSPKGEIKALNSSRAKTLITSDDASESVHERSIRIEQDAPFFFRETMLFIVNLSAGNRDRVHSVSTVRW